MEVNIQSILLDLFQKYGEDIVVMSFLQLCNSKSINVFKSRGKWETKKDKHTLDESHKRILKLLSDYQWHSRDEIETAAGERGIPAKEGLRRLRELKCFNVPIDKVRISGMRSWSYRITPKELRHGKEE